MKKLTSVILSISIFFACIPLVYASTGDVTVTASTPILISQNATDQEEFAAERISYYLGLVFGIKPEITTDTDGTCIAVGSAAKADTSVLEENGYLITAKNGCVQIAGTGIRGTIQGAYRFLEEFADVHNYTSTLITTAHTDTIEVPSDTDILYAPYFEFTETDWRSPHDTEYSIANGLCGNTYRSLTDAQGGTVGYISGSCHTLSTQFCSASKYAESNPEYFAIHDGKRYTDQLCLSNPDVVKVVTQEVLDLIKARHNPEASLQIVSLSQHDNTHYCECENCKAIDDANGGNPSGSIIVFVNKVAQAVKDAGYDNVAIDTFAYQYSRSAPTQVKPLDNVIVRICTIECCFCHTLDDPDCSANAKLMADLEDWSEICNRIYIWGYTTNYANTCCVYPNFGVIQRNMQIYYEHNVKGVYEEGNYFIDSCDTEFGELRAYMIAKFMQNPYADCNEVVNGFIEAYYGEAAAPAMRKIIDKYIEHAGGRYPRQKNPGAHLGIYYECDVTFTMSDYNVYEIDCLWEEAKNADVTDTQMENILRSELSWRWYKCNEKRGEFSVFNTHRFGNNERFYQDLKAAGVLVSAEAREGEFLEYQDYMRYSTGFEWTNRYSPKTESKKNSIAYFGPVLEKLTVIFTGFNAIYSLFNACNSVIKDVKDANNC